MEKFEYDQDPGHAPYKHDCQHSQMTKEVISGQSTGDYICDSCQAVLSPSEARAARAQRKP